MIDTWLTAAVLFALITVGALIRLFRASGPHDRILAALLTVTFGSAAGLLYAISIGTIIILDATIVISLICCAGIIAWTNGQGGVA
jgi:multisubunit Na+/H+ antiporter MnhF subunit